MNYVLFCASFFICAVIFCAAFLFCVRTIYITKNQKLDPVFTVKTPKQISAKKTIDREEALKRMLENG